jgi:hypothetical protein
MARPTGAADPVRAIPPIVASARVVSAPDAEGHPTPIPVVIASAPRGSGSLAANRRPAQGRGPPMWKSACLAAGIFACAVGAELLIVDSVMLLPIDGAGEARPFVAPDWAPWSLVSAGAVTIMHCLTGGGAPTPAPRRLSDLHG